MKKFFLGVAIAMISLFTASCSSCSSSNGNALSVVWDVNVAATGSGKVEVTFPTGSFNAAGDAVIGVSSSNDTTKLLNTVLLSEALVSNDANTVAFAQEVETQLNDSSVFNVTVLEGTWSVDITGYAKQPETGIYIVIDQHWPKQ